jgi:exodeoxyribonuclease VII large subunit
MGEMNSLFAEPEEIKKTAAKKAAVKKAAPVAKPVQVPSELVFSVNDYLDFVTAALAKMRVPVIGEVSSFKQHPTGIYFTLKDANEDAVLECYCNPYSYRSLGVELSDGLQIKATGYGRVFKRKGKLTFQVEEVELVGEGSLQKAYEALKKKLAEEGLFERKRAMPEFIRDIGVITSKTGAVIDDFKRNLEKRGYRLHMWDTRVEGTAAVSGVIAGIRHFNGKLGNVLDVVVVMRGGGSLEDLQAFNDERVVREMYASRIPTIAAIGHDRDVPLVAMTADRLESTPTAAAMRVNMSWDRLSEELPQLSGRILHGWELAHSRVFAAMRRRAETAYAKLHLLLQKPEAYRSRIFNAYALAFNGAAARLSASARVVVAADPRRNLKLGYSILKGPDGRVLKNADSLAPGDSVSAQLSQGMFCAEVKTIQTENNG